MDLCTECGERAAHIFITMTINNAQVDLRLCEECAAKRATDDGIVLDVPMEDDIDMLPDASSLRHPLVDPEAHPSVCPHCGLSAAEFAQTELLGCDTCYVAHADLLRDVLTAIQGVDPVAAKNSPRVKRRFEAEIEIRELTEQLNAAVAREEYIRAAELRDEITALRAGLDG